MSFETLKSGRVVLGTFRDQQGRPVFMEVFNPQTQTMQIAAVPDREHAMTGGPAVSEVEIPELMEHFMEEDQTFWRWADPRKKNLILMPHAFHWCEPQVGDQLQDPRYRDVFTVRHAAPGRDVIPWNGSLLLDKETRPETRLRWIGEAGGRNYIDFHEEDGKAETPTPGEDSSGDMGITYSQVVKPTITYLLETQRPGSIGGKPFGSSTEPKPRVRERLTDALAPQQTVTIYGQWMDNVFRFLCIHPRTVVATRLARWFKGFMERNRPSLKFNGIPDIRYWSQDATRRSRRGDDSAVREVRYYFRTEELEVRRQGAIRHVGIDLAVKDHLDFGKEGADWASLSPFTGSLYDESGHYMFADLDIADTRQTGAYPG